MENSVYLHDIPLSQAKQAFAKALEKAGLWQVLREETLSLDENLVGRTLSQPVWAKQSSPHYHASAMDGFALKAEDTIGAEPDHPVTLELPQKTVYIDTGDALPVWANAVVPIENIEAIDEKGKISENLRRPAAIRLRAGLTPWSHVRPMGEDLVTSQLVLASGQVLRPVDLGAIAASGTCFVTVSCKPRVGILPTGSELAPVGQPVKAGEIIEFNSIVLAGQVKDWGAIPERYSITPDKRDLLSQRIQQAADENDLVLINAGSSAGSEDFTAGLVDELGELLVHGVAVRPGHPVILGLLRRSSKRKINGDWAAVIGIPGYPVSAALTGEIFVEPLLAKWFGREPAEALEIEARLTRKVSSPAGDDDYMRVVVGRVGKDLLAAPLSRGAGVISSLVKADGICILPRGTQGLEMGARVKVRLYRQPHELENTIFAIGSHDMTLDLVAQHLARYDRRLVSANVGSQGGLVAIQRGEAHLAGSHLLDPESGEYNISAIHNYLDGIPIRLVGWVNREQGLMVVKGNPKGIKDLADLAREDVTFVNRQRGAGTRVLLDYHLQKLGISSKKIKGYDLEEYTHLAVAAAVASGRADCGLGVTAAAIALDLDFIPLFQERYDLVVPQEFAGSDLLQPFWNLMNQNSFQKEISALPGYDISPMGKVFLDERKV